MRERTLPCVEGQNQKMEDDPMTSLIPHGKEVSVVHFNPDWGYLAYIVKALNLHGEPTWKVVRVSLEGDTQG